ncbi:MAG: YheT family hydrolase [Flammeovirgaceae bacterium]
MTNYQPPWVLFNRHIETVYPALLRKVSNVAYQRERIYTTDGDFLDLDWVPRGSRKLVIISHGLEGNTQRAYIKGMAKAFVQQGFDALAWNYRGCSEEINRQLRFYHSGATDDLDAVIQHAAPRYEQVFLVGFSLGGNLTLKYVGERGSQVHPKIKKAVAFSVPIDLHTSCLQISRPENWLYTKRFLNSLEKKVVAKSRAMSGLDLSHFSTIKTLMDFDEYYTAPLHGFAGAIDYYQRCSALQFLGNIAIPTLLVNAQNDPFLSKECFPTKINNPNFTFESPARGGHVGFSLFGNRGRFWSELRAVDFVTASPFKNTNA